MLKCSDIFNVDTLNIFTDASIYKTETETIGCFGVIARTMDKEKDAIINDRHYLDFIDIARHSTNNDSELRAIRLGVYIALRYRNYFKTINLFSDSMISIMGLKSWIFSWARSVSNGIMYGSSGEVLNQELIKDILFTILNNRLDINLFHQRGHITDKKLQMAKESFIKVNDIKDDVDMDLIKTISYFNNCIDEETRNTLQFYMSEYYPWHKDVDKLQRAISFDINKFDSKIYNDLIRRRL